MFHFQGNSAPDNDRMNVTGTRLGTTSIHTLNPAADASVRSGAYANQNFGTSSPMQADTEDSGTITQSYVRYSIGNLGTITSAKLRFYITNGTSSGPELKKLSDTTWGETTLTWNNMPAVDGALLGTMGGASAGGWVELDVTSHVTSNSVLSFALVPRSSDGMGMNTREASSNKPELVISSVQSSCGDGLCETGENATSCAADCGTTLYTASFDDGCDYTYKTTCEPWASKGKLDTCEFTCGSVSSSTSCGYGGNCAFSNLDNLAVVTAPSRCSRAVKVTLFGGQVRAEMRDRSVYKLDAVADGEDVGTREYWVGVAYYIPSTTEYPNTDAYQAVLLQWHTASGQVTGGDDDHIGNPVIGLRLRWLNNTLTWRVEGEVNATTSCSNCLCTASGTPTNSCKTGSVGSSCSTCETHRTIGIGPAVERNVWYDWVFRVRFSKNDANGYVQAWVRKQGDTPWTLVGGETRYNMHPDVYKGGQFLKLGLYDSSSTSGARSLYIDQLRVMESTNLSNDAARLEDMRRQVDPAVCPGG
ncbi:MAG TPA: DNRLRE domain-containing protein [Archangium sp.]|nr:DNRLRE domain-containing protein [Archangium sp.]